MKTNYVLPGVLGQLCQLKEVSILLLFQLSLLVCGLLNVLFDVEIKANKYFLSQLDLKCYWVLI